MKNRRGEIATILMLGAVVVMGVTAVISSFTQSNKQSTSSRASGSCAGGYCRKVTSGCGTGLYDSGLKTCDTGYLCCKPGTAPLPPTTTTCIPREEIKCGTTCCDAESETCSSAKECVKRVTPPPAAPSCVSPLTRCGQTADNLCCNPNTHDCDSFNKKCVLKSTPFEDTCEGTGELYCAGAGRCCNSATETCNKTLKKCETKPAAPAASYSCTVGTAIPFTTQPQCSSSCPAGSKYVPGSASNKLVNGKFWCCCDGATAPVVSPITKPDCNSVSNTGGCDSNCKMVLTSPPKGYLCAATPPPVVPGAGTGAGVTGVGSNGKYSSSDPGFDPGACNVAGPDYRDQQVFRCCNRLFTFTGCYESPCYGASANQFQGCNPPQTPATDPGSTTGGGGGGAGGLYPQNEGRTEGMACCFSQGTNRVRVYAHAAARAAADMSTPCTKAGYGTAYGATNWFECPDNTPDDTTTDIYEATVGAQTPAETPSGGDTDCKKIDGRNRGASCPTTSSFTAIAGGTQGWCCPAGATPPAPDVVADPNAPCTGGVRGQNQSDCSGYNTTEAKYSFKKETTTTGWCCPTITTPVATAGCDTKFANCAPGMAKYQTEKFTYYKSKSASCTGNCYSATSSTNCTQSTWTQVANFYCNGTPINEAATNTPPAGCIAMVPAGCESETKYRYTKGQWCCSQGVNPPNVDTGRGSATNRDGGGGVVPALPAITGRTSVACSAFCKLSDTITNSTASIYQGDGGNYFNKNNEYMSGFDAYAECGCELPSAKTGNITVINSCAKNISVEGKNVAPGASYSVSSTQTKLTIKTQSGSTYFPSLKTLMNEENCNTASGKDCVINIAQGGYFTDCD